MIPAPASIATAPIAPASIAPAPLSLSVDSVPAPASAAPRGCSGHSRGVHGPCPVDHVWLLNHAVHIAQRVGEDLPPVVALGGQPDLQRGGLREGKRHAGVARAVVAQPAADVAKS